MNKEATLRTRTASSPPQASALIPKPIYRSLRVFAFDPSASRKVDTAIINDTVINVAWERPWEDPVTLGPVNEYLEVVDFDPASGCFYEPLDLNDPMLLAQQGLPPSDGNPQFHQQMVFAVAMNTIRAFENALGRSVFWMKERTAAPDGSSPEYPEFVRRLRIYPHALREANAFYSPQRTALLFGYFRGAPGRDATGGEWVFSCLSQDIIAHETTHAILHGLWRRSVEASNIDSLAFHEAFADVVALFQHFASRGIVEHQLARSGGSVRSASLLNGLAEQFGRGIGREGPLRFALKMLIEEQEELGKPDGTLEPDRNAKITEPHARGQILVAAIFDAFATIFERRTDDLFRITGLKRGTAEPLPHELVARLAEEAEKTADQVLRMCIRGLDYLPPVDATFGEYLRAILTADADLVADDRLHYRTAFAESFIKRGIRTEGQVFSSTETLYWETPDRSGDGEPGASAVSASLADCTFWEVLSRLHLGITYGSFEVRAQRTKGHERPLASRRPEHARTDAERDKLRDQLDATVSDIVRKKSFAGVSGYLEGFEQPEVQRNLRDLSMLIVLANQAIMHEWLDEPSDFDREWERLLGIRFGPDTNFQTIRAKDGKPVFEVPFVRISRRQSPDGDILPQLIVKVVQTRRAYFDKDMQEQADAGAFKPGDPEFDNPDFKFRGGATLIVDLRDGRVQRVIRKRVDDNERLKRVRAFLSGDTENMAFDDHKDGREREPFAMLHRDAAL